MRLFEVIQLNEYNKQATLNNWGERIAQAAKFNFEHMEDDWLKSLGPIYDDKEFNVKVVGKILDALEKMDPTKNKQYVMTLVRWYIGNIKKDKQNQAEFREMQKREPEKFAKYKDYKDVPGNVAGGELNDEYPELWIQPQSMDTFKIEDAEQIKTALERYHSMKPQLPQNERDIGRFKDFYRFEDFVDSKLDPGATEETDSEVLKRKDVDVLYNGPMGTVTIPRSKEASCKLGKGTRWCTAGKYGNLYDDYAKRGDLIIYNEKPGNAKYQFHIDVERMGSRGMQATDARDRQLSPKQIKYFTEQHPVMSKYLQRAEKQAFATMMNKSFTQDKDLPHMQNYKLKSLFALNSKYGGGPRKYLDSYIISDMKRVEQENTSSKPEFIEQAIAYAQQRGKPWPAFEEMSIAHLNRFFMSVMADKSRNSYLSGQGTKGDALMNLVRDNVIGPEGKTIKRYLEQLLKYKKSVNPGWKGIDNFVKAYQNAMSKDRDVLPTEQERQRREKEIERVRKPFSDNHPQT